MKYIANIVLVLIASAIFISLIGDDRVSDIFSTNLNRGSHVDLLRENVQRNRFINPPIYYYSVYVLSGFRVDSNANNAAALVLMLIAVSIKYKISTRYLDTEWENSKFALLAAAGAMVSMPIISELSLRGMYLGKLPPNVWHNSTTIAVMPFVMLLHGKIVNQYSQKQEENISVLSLLIVVIALLKPSYLYVVVVALPVTLMTSRNLRWNKANASIFVMSLLAVAALFIMINIFGIDPQGGPVRSYVALRPFDEWTALLRGRSMLLAIVSSFAFAAWIVVARWRMTFVDHEFRYVTMSLLVSIAVFVVFAEQGGRSANGNFVWGVVICHYLVFLYGTRILAWMRRENVYLSRLSRIGLFIWSAHVCSGIIYVSKIVLFGTWL